MMMKQIKMTILMMMIEIIKMIIKDEWNRNDGDVQQHNDCDKENHNDADDDWFADYEYDNMIKIR